MGEYNDFVIKNDPITISLIEMIEIQSTPIETVLEEGITSRIKDFGKSLLNNNGLLGQLARAGKELSKLIIAAIKGDKTTVKEISKKISKEDVLQFLINLDYTYLHLITPYIHTIDGVTGWHLMEKIEKYAEKGKKTIKEIIKKIKKSIAFIKNAITNIIDKTKQEIYRQALNKLEKELEIYTKA
jgi:hypothetical protein